MLDVGTGSPVDSDAASVQLLDDWVDARVVLIDGDSGMALLDLEPGPSRATDSVAKAIVEIAIATDEVVVLGFVEEDTERGTREEGPGPMGTSTDTVESKGATIEVDGFVEDGTKELACGKVIITVVAKSEADTIFVEKTVIVTGDAVLGAMVIVSVVSRLRVTVSITVIVAASDVELGPPSTGTTEYDTPLGLICNLSWFWESTGRAWVNVERENSAETNEGIETCMASEIVCIKHDGIDCCYTVYLSE